MEQIYKFTDEYYTNMIELLNSNSTNLKGIKMSEIRAVLDSNKKKIIEQFIIKIKNMPKSTRNKQPIFEFIDTHFKPLKENKETNAFKNNLGFNGLEGYQKITKIMKYLYENNELDIEDEDYNIMDHLEEYSSIKIPENETISKEVDEDFKDTEDIPEEEEKLLAKKKKKKTKKEKKKPKSESDSDSD